MARVDYDLMANAYDRAREVGLEGLVEWRRELARHLPAPSRLPILDVGSGTGQFAHAFVRWFDLHVVAIEPSRGMRAEASRRRKHPRIDYVGGAAEAIPLARGSCGGAWLSTVIHHVGDLRACACELRRVVAPGGRVLIRNAFPGRLEHISLFRFFPEARAVAEGFPTVSDTLRAFAGAGFAFESLRAIPQTTAPDLEDFRARVLERADTTLAALTEDQFQRGLDALDRELSEERIPRPVVDSLDLLVLR